MGPAYAKRIAGTTGRDRRRLDLAVCSALTLALALGTARAGDAPAPAETLTGAAAWARIVGNTVAGTTPDGPYTEFFAADGSLRLADADGKAGGHWAMRDAMLCTKVEDEDEECRSLEITGSAGAFTDAAGSRYAFEILPGNAKDL